MDDGSKLPNALLAGQQGSQKSGQSGFDLARDWTV
jgi:hypothetical protein